MPLHDRRQDLLPAPCIAQLGNKPVIVLLLNTCCKGLRGCGLLLLQVLQPGPGVGTSGQVAKVRLENFMCHDNLEINFTYALQAVVVHSTQAVIPV